MKSRGAGSKSRHGSQADGKSPARTDERASSGTAARADMDNGTLDERLRLALHGGLGQLLTSISFLASSLRQKLAERELPEALQAAEILSLTGRAISETQALVRDDSSGQRCV